MAVLMTPYIAVECVLFTGDLIAFLPAVSPQLSSIPHLSPSVGMTRSLRIKSCK